MGSGCLAAQSCGTWTTFVVSYTNAISLLLNWNSFQPTETHGKVPVPVAWQHTTWLQIKQPRIDVPVGTIHPTRQLLVRDAHSAAESVLPISACAVITSTSATLLAAQTSSSNSTDYCKQASESSPVRDRRCTTEPPNQLCIKFKVFIFTRSKFTEWVTKFKNSDPGP